MVIGATFIREDDRQVPTKTTVMEVDEDTGKLLLEYANGTLEWVQPNVVQEALLSREDEGAGLYTFKKILNHRTTSNGKVEVEVLWDTDEVTWEPLTHVRKDDPITVAKYAMDNKLQVLDKVCDEGKRDWSFIRRSREYLVSA